MRMNIIIWFIIIPRWYHYSAQRLAIYFDILLRLSFHHASHFTSFLILMLMSCLCQSPLPLNTSTTPLSPMPFIIDVFIYSNIATNLSQLKTFSLSLVACCTLLQRRSDVLLQITTMTIPKTLPSLIHYITDLALYIFLYRGRWYDYDNYKFTLPPHYYWEAIFYNMHE